MHVPEMFSDHRMFMFLYALMEMAASVSNIICIAQITYEFVYYTLLVDQGRLVFCDSQVISDLFACKQRLYLLVNFCSQIAKLSANHVGRFLIFKFLHSCEKQSCVDDKRFARSNIVVNSDRLYRLSTWLW